jgi:hypothetical protein
MPSAASMASPIGMACNDGSPTMRTSVDPTLPGRIEAEPASIEENG